MTEMVETKNAQFDYFIYPVLILAHLSMQCPECTVSIAVVHPQLVYLQFSNSSYAILS